MSQSRLSFDNTEPTRRQTRNSQSVAMDASRHLDKPDMTQQRDDSSQQGPSGHDHILRDILHQLTLVNTRLDSIDTKFDREVGELRMENNRLNQRVSELEERHDSLESQSRRNNLIFHGITDSENGRETWEETEEKVRNFMVDKMDMTREDADTLPIERAHRLPGKRGHRPVIAKFLSYKDKDRVQRRARDKLRDDEVCGVRDDLTKRVRDTRAKLYPFMRDAREAGRLASMSFDKLRIDGIQYRYDWEMDDIVPIRRPFQPRNRVGRPTTDPLFAEDETR